MNPSTRSPALRAGSLAQGDSLFLELEEVKTHHDKNLPSQHSKITPATAKDRKAFEQLASKAFYFPQRKGIIEVSITDR